MNSRVNGAAPQPNKIHNFLTEYDQQQYDQKLRILLIQFFREQRLPYSTVDSPRLQEILHFLNPSITPPNFDNLLKLSVNYNDQYNYSMMMDGHGTQMFQRVGPSYEIPLKLAQYPNVQHFLELSNAGEKLVNSNAPCVVCLEKCEWSRKRKLTRSEATVFSFVCVVEKVYPMEVAQRLCELKTTCSCVDHLKPVYEEVLKQMGISNSDQLPQIPEHVIADAYALINKIRDPNYDEKANSLKSPAPFRHTLYSFFKNFDQKIPKMRYQQVMTNLGLRAPPTKRARESIESSSSNYTATDTAQYPLDFPEDFLEY